MLVLTKSFKTPLASKPNLRIANFTKLGSDEAKVIREEIAKCQSKNFDTVYVDTKDVEVADLSGINELIHSHYTLQNSTTKFVLVYRKKSVVEKWVETTGLDNFIDTAILPAI